MGRVSLVLCFSFQHSEYVLPNPLGCRVSLKSRLIVSHMWFPLYVTSCFSLSDFKILSLSLTFAILLQRVLRRCLWFHPDTHSVSWTSRSVFFPRSGTFSAIISLDRVSVSPSATLYCEHQRAGWCPRGPLSWPPVFRFCFLFLLDDFHCRVLQMADPFHVL